MAIKRLGSLLVEEQMITEDQLQEALQSQKKTGDQLGEALVKLGYISEEALYRFLAVQNGLDFMALEGVEIASNLASMMTVQVARRFRAVPIAQDNGHMVVATSQPDDLALSFLPKEIKLGNLKLKVVVAPSSKVSALLDKHYPLPQTRGSGDIQSRDEAIQEVDKQAADANQVNLLESAQEELINPEDISLEVLREEGAEEDEEEGGKGEGPTIKICDFIIIDGVRKRASDIHLTPFEKKMTLKYRIDGSLIEFRAPPASYKRRLATRFKIMAKLNIIEKRRPQDGRISMKVDGKNVEVRISTMPTRWGENVVMRIVDQANAVLDIDLLGFETDQLDLFKKAVAQPYGMVFVTGPTASGKTTTLFAALNYLNTPAKNIVTIEDPVEYRLPHVIQIQVDNAAGRSFASVLRSFLRHDPNIMLVGEIRDAETADIAVKASLTGHLVLSSIHTNDAPSTLMRLTDLGIDPVYVGASVLAVASQRLVKRICDKCKEPFKASEEELLHVGLNPEDIATATIFKGRGCDNCNQTGYKGRLAVFEVLPMTAAIRETIFARGTLNQIKAAAKGSGFKSLREAALIKWKQGHTTLEEVLGETFE
jgi:type IV pilus assembly protein PilB